MEIKEIKVGWPNVGEQIGVIPVSDRITIVERAKVYPPHEEVAYTVLPLLYSRRAQAWVDFLTSLKRKTVPFTELLSYFEENGYFDPRVVNYFARPTGIVPRARTIFSRENPFELRIGLCELVRQGNSARLSPVADIFGVPIKGSEELARLLSERSAGVSLQPTIGLETGINVYQPLSQLGSEPRDGIHSKDLIQ